MNKFTAAMILIVLSCLNENLFSQDVEVHKTSEGIEFGLWNTDIKKPAPALIILSATIDQSLGNSYFRQCGNQLAAHGFLAVSVDLPSHGKFQIKGEKGGLGGWRIACERKENFAGSVVSRLSKVLDHLIEKKMVDPEKIAVCGTSRGGFIALHLAAADPRVNCVAAYAPVTELLVLNEFKSIKDNTFSKQLSIINQAKEFNGKKIWLMIGDRDKRVGTDESIQFIRAITKISLEKGQSPNAEIHVVPEPKGHTTPEGAAELSAEWILKQLKIER